MKAEILGTDNRGGQELLCTVMVVQGRLLVTPTAGHEKWKDFIFTAGDVPGDDGRAIDPDRSPTKWLLGLPKLFNGHRIRARLVK